MIPCFLLGPSSALLWNSQVAFLLVHCIRATAIITEAATLIVADHVDSDKALLNTNKEGTSEALEKKTEVQMQKDEKKNITPIM